MKKLIILTCLFILLIGCKRKTELYEGSQDVNSFVIGGEYNHSEILEFRLSDGTKCVVVDSDGVSCNWK